MPATGRRRIWRESFSRASPASTWKPFRTRVGRPRSTVSSADKSRYRSTTPPKRQGNWKAARCARLRSPPHRGAASFPRGLRLPRPCPAMIRKSGWDCLAAAHAYQVGAARDELARHFHVDQDLLRRAPNLLIVSSNGAGYDPVDVEACTAAGVAVLNQSGGNAHSVAEHALAMLITLSKRIIQADRAIRREANVNRNALMGTEVQGKTIGIVGLGNVGRRIAALCRGLLGMNVLAYDPYLST